MTDISDDAVRAFMAAEVPGILDEHLDLAVKSVDGDKIRAGLAAALPYLLEQDRTEKMIDLEYRVVDAEGALAELVRLKDGPRDEEYERAKPIAWSRARAVLGQQPNLEPTRCPYDPRELLGAPIGMFHCPACGCMQLAGVEHLPCDPDECALPDSPDAPAPVEE